MRRASGFSRYGQAHSRFLSHPQAGHLYSPVSVVTVNPPGARSIVSFKAYFSGAAPTTRGPMAKNAQGQVEGVQGENLGLHETGPTEGRAA